MKVKRTQALAGTDFSFIPGDVVEVNDLVGEAWIEIGHAVAVDDDTPVTNSLGGPVETATAPPAPERATAPEQKSKKKAKK